MKGVALPVPTQRRFPLAYVKFLPVSLLGALELYRASMLDPGYKGGGHSFRATKTKLGQINPEAVRTAGQNRGDIDRYP